MGLKAPQTDTDINTKTDAHVDTEGKITGTFRDGQSNTGHLTPDTVCTPVSFLLPATSHLITTIFNYSGLFLLL